MSAIVSRNFFIYFIYNFMMLFVIILCFPLAFFYVLGSPKRRINIVRRLGFSNDVSPKTNQAFHPVWVHALSVGEVQSAVPLVREIKKRFPNRPIVFSTATLTGYDRAKKTMTSWTDTIFYFPLDLLFSVKKVIGKVNPIACIIVETDLWPNFIWEMQRHHVPLFLVNARLSDKSFRRYRNIRWLFQPVFHIFNRIFVQSGEDARRFRRLGVFREKINNPGNLKFDQPVHTAPLPRRISKIVDSVRSRDGYIFIAGSTHPGEEEIVFRALADMRKTIPNLLSIVAPRQPGRASEIGDIIRNKGFRPVLFSKVAGNDAPDVIIIDSIGLLKDLYALCDTAFIGGSLVPFGGHNPLEAAAFGKPILFGPHTHDFRDISRKLIQAEGAVRVITADEIKKQSLAWFQDRDKAIDTGKRAQTVFQSNQGAAARTLDVIFQDILERKARK